MAIVIREEQQPGLLEALGQGLGAGLARGGQLALESLFAQRQGQEQDDQFQAKLQALANAGNRDQAMRLVVSGGLAQSPDDLIKLTRAVGELFPEKPEPKRFDAQVVDEDTGAVFTLKLTADEINDPAKLRRAFPGRNFRLAAEGEKKPIEWYTPDGKFLKRSVKRPEGALTKEELEAAKAPQLQKGDLLDPTGALKNETTNAIRRLALSYLTERDAEGRPLEKPNPKVLSYVIDRAAELIRSRQAPDVIPAVVTAVDEALQRFAGEFRRTVPLPSSVKEDLAARSVGYAEGLDAINNVMPLLGDAIGLRSNVAQLVNYVTGVASELGLAEGIKFPNTADARAKLGVIERILTAALVENPKIPVYEQAIVKPLIPKPSQWFTSPQLAFEKLRSLADYLKGRARFVSEKFGVPTVPTPTFAETIRTMPPEALVLISPESLGPEERKALDERLRELGY